MSKCIALLCFIIAVSGCTTVRQFSENSAIELKTLSSSVALTVRSSEQAMSASGYLVYRKPDKIHIIVLSPFGSTVFEAFALGDQMILAYPSEYVAFVGTLDELPERGIFSNWRSIYWVLEGAGHQSTLLDKNVVVENGLVVQKNRDDGVKVYYANRTNEQGVLLAHELDVRNSKDDQLRLVLDDPLVNGQLEDSAFTPNLAGYKIYPLKALEQP